jgi:hypothetical protein
MRGPAAVRIVALTIAMSPEGAGSYVEGYAVTTVGSAGSGAHRA